MTSLTWLRAAAAAAALTILAAGPAGAVEPPIYMLSPEGDALLKGAEQQDFLPLMTRFVSEEQSAFCGIASSVMALNALGVPAPTAPRWYPYAMWDQDNIFSETVLKQVKPEWAVEGEGLTLDQLKTVLDVSGAKAERTFASDSDVDKFRAAARAAIADPDAVLIVNFSRATFGQAGIDGGGHISPVAAYNPESDRFLVLDVARYKYPPSWATAETLYAAMNTIDTSSGKTRGFVVVRK